MTSPSSDTPAALLIAPRFFGYEALISAELERQGLATTFIDERPSNSSIARAAIRTARPLTRTVIDRYYRKWLSDLDGRKFVVILVIKAEVVPRWFLNELRQRHSAARFVFYAYDSIQNSGEFLQLLDCFDEAFTFDRDDASRHPGLTYHPLFYAPDYAQGGSHDRPITLAFAGTLHSRRHLVTTPIFESLTGSETRCFFYVPARWYFLLLKYVTGHYRSVRWRDVSFAPMSRAATVSLFRSAHAVLDIHHPRQHGLGPRAFEALASGCILVTTNRSIELEPFFDNEHVIVIPSDPDELDPQALADRLRSMPHPERPPTGLEDYTAHAWVKRIALPDNSGGADDVGATNAVPAGPTDDRQGGHE